MKLNCVSLLFVLLFVSACGGISYSDIIYQTSDQHLENPERGFMEYTISHASNPDALTKGHLDWLREQDGITLIWRNWVLDSFLFEPTLTPEFLDLVRSDLQTLRTARISAVVRFCYTVVFTGGAPYGDADKPTMLSHISQLGSILHEFEDVILVLQAGFIGTWGEWYYTTHFGDPDYLDWSNPDNVRGLTPQQWNDRHDVLNALLQAAPSNMTVQIRYPQTKYHLLDDTTSTTEADMQSTNKKFRISHHNDCFLSSSTDVGTYIDYSQEFPYLMNDTKYSPIGGEVCSQDQDGGNRHQCPNALYEMAALHYSYLNQAYNRIVLYEWLQDGCYDDFHRLLGYRLVLRRASLPVSIAKQRRFVVTIEMENIGYSAPTRNRDVLFVMQDASGINYAASLGYYDIRTWLPGKIITVTASLNMNLEPGVYKAFLALVSKYDATKSFSDYNILTANIDTPNTTLGLNDLHYTVQVTARRVKLGRRPFNILDQTPSEYSRIYCGFGTCATSCANLPIANPSFEQADSSWNQFSGGYTFTQDQASDGIQAIRVANGGAQQTFYPASGTRGVKLQADALSESIVGSNGNDYSVYCDFLLSDGSWSYGHTANFDVSNVQWHTATLVYDATQDINECWCYAMFRNYASGTAMFDNFAAWQTSGSATQC